MVGTVESLSGSALHSQPLPTPCAAGYGQQKRKYANDDFQELIRHPDCGA
jgi:hypothetical protein